MDALLGFPVIGAIAGFGVLAHLLTRMTRAVIRRQFPRTHRSLERNEVAKHALPLAWGVVVAVSVPSFMYAMVGVMFPDGICLYALLWSKIILGLAAGVVSALAYKWIRGAIKARTASVQSRDDVPLDADRE